MRQLQRNKALAGICATLGHGGAIYKADQQHCLNYGGSLVRSNFEGSLDPAGHDTESVGRSRLESRSQPYALIRR